MIIGGLPTKNRRPTETAMKGLLGSGALLIVALAWACGGSPTSPSPTPAPSHRLRLSGPAAILIPGQSVQLTATKIDYDGTKTVTTDRTQTAVWLSSDLTVATVSSAGLVLAVAAGSAEVSASADGLTSSLTVRVTPSHDTLNGQIDPEVAADIIAQNQDVGVGANKNRGIITRFELPIRVYVDPEFTRLFGADCAKRGAAPWQSATGLPLLFVNDNVEPRVQVVTLVTGDNRARTFLDSVNLDNSLRVVSLVIPTPWAPLCDEDTMIHEFGHVLGIAGHPEWGGVMAYVYGNPGVRQPSVREVRLVTELYKLPLGAHLESDGSWVIQWR
jgi:hypothetical protein